jgi:hypothetical protein
MHTTFSDKKLKENENRVKVKVCEISGSYSGQYEV